MGGEDVSGTFAERSLVKGVVMNVCGTFVKSGLK